MSFAELVDWLLRLADEGQLTRAQAFDIIEQRRLFDAQRQMIEAEFRGHVVGYCAMERLVDDTVAGLLDRVLETHSGRRQVYFESVSAVALTATLP